MAKRLSAPHPIARIMALAAIMLLLLLGGMLVASGRQNAARCTGNCQACYCDVIEKRDGVDVCIVNGAASACIGCVGSCTSSDHCKAMPGVGGCGAYIAWVRDSDCLYTPPPETPDAHETPALTATPAATPTATPPPPIACPARTWVRVKQPAADIAHEPPFPLVARQDSTNTGFTLHFHVSGGWAEKKEQKPQQMCRQSGRTYPDDCPNDWRWVCVRRTLAHYDDPIVQVDLGMRLGDGVKAWIEQDLGSRYYGAHVQDDLPHVWNLYQGRTLSWTDDFEYHPYDPGVHGGRLFVTTRGTPLNESQKVSFPYTVPVYLWDTTMGGD